MATEKNNPIRKLTDLASYKLYKQLWKPKYKRVQGEGGVFYQDALGMTPLHWAAVNGSSKQIKAFLSTVPHYISRADYLGRLPLHHASIAGNVEAAEALLGAFPASVIAVDHAGFTPLHYAAQSGREEVTLIYLGKAIGNAHRALFSSEALEKSYIGVTLIEDILARCASNSKITSILQQGQRRLLELELIRISSISAQERQELINQVEETTPGFIELPPQIQKIILSIDKLMLASKHDEPSVIKHSFLSCAYSALIDSHAPLPYIGWISKVYDYGRTELHRIYV